MTDELPFVTCVCVCGKSDFNLEKLLPQAIESFRRQSYPADNRELLLVSENMIPRKLDELFDGINYKIRDEVGWNECGCRPSLGFLRNYCLRYATSLTGASPLICQWDSDDYHHPDRLMAQVRCLMEHPEAEACCLARQLCYDFASDVGFVRTTGACIHGTILHRIGTARYPEKGKEEDTDFIRQMKGVAILDNDPSLYVRLSHGDNTWNREHIMREFCNAPPGTRHMPSWCKSWLEEVVGKYDIPIGVSNAEAK